jgi:DNA repair photolyase
MCFLFCSPTHAYLGMSSGIDFETRIVYKPDAAQRLREELSRPGYVCKHIMLGSSTDDYPTRHDVPPVTCWSSNGLTAIDSRQS